jgi:putative inorganic carbon (HCO3(-)) transporter
MRSYLFMLLYVCYLPTIFVSLFAGALLWCWISIMIPHEMIWVPLPVGPAATIVAVMGCAFILSRENKIPPNTTVTWAMVVMMLASTLSLIFSVDRGLSFDRWDSTIKGLVLALLMLALLNSRLRIQALVWVLVLSMGHHGAKNGLQSLVTGGAFRGAGPGGMIGDNNHIATAMIMVVPLMVYLAFQSANRIVRVGCWALAGLTVIATFFTYSRGGFLAMLAMGAVLWFRSTRKLPILVAFIALALFFVQFAPDQIWERFGTIRDYEEDSSATGRLRIWKVGLAMFAERPLFGYGFHSSTIPEVVFPHDPTLKPKAMHNSYLEALAEAGIFTFLCHVTLLISSFLQTQRVRKWTCDLVEWRWAFDLASMLQVGLAGYAVGSFFLSLAFFDGFWFLAILATSLRLLVQRSIAPAGLKHAWVPGRTMSA